MTKTTITTTDNYRQDLSTAKQHGLVFKGNPKAAVLYTAIDEYNHAINCLRAEQLATDIELEVASEVFEELTGQEWVDTLSIDLSTLEQPTMETPASESDINHPWCESSSDDLLTEYTKPPIDTTIDDECADDISVPLNIPIDPQGHSAALVMVVVVIAFLATAKGLLGAVRLLWVGVTTAWKMVTRDKSVETPIDYFSEVTWSTL